MAADNDVDGCVDTLLCGKELSDSDIQALNDLLKSRTARELWSIASNVSVRLTGSVRKNDIVSRLIGMAKIGATHRPDDNEAELEHFLYY